LRFEFGCDPKSEKFKEYWSRNGYEENIDDVVDIIKDPAQLIIWIEDNKIVGHAVWHESSVEKHRKGGSFRDKDDKEALKKLLGKKKDFVELHEWWLIEEYRGKGYGSEFFGFFESYMKSKGHVDIIYYANDPSAIAVFRKHRCKEGGFVETAKEYIFYHLIE